MKALFSKSYCSLILTTDIKNPKGEYYSFSGCVGSEEEAAKLLQALGLYIDLEVIN